MKGNFMEEIYFAFRYFLQRRGRFFLDTFKFCFISRERAVVQLEKLSCDPMNEGPA